MCFRLRGPLSLMAAFFLISTSMAQTVRSVPGHASAVWKLYCQPNGGFCFKYPASWALLGEVFNGNGVIVAPEQKQERELWDVVTVGQVVPPPQEDQDPVSIDRIIEQTLASLREQGQNVETLQRQQRTVDGAPAQLLKLRYHDKASGHDWIEQLVFIEGRQSEIYSVALKASPQALPRLEPTLARLLESWKLPEAETPTDSDEGDAPEIAPPPEKAPAAPESQTAVPPKD
jgi:hypothetical protein